MLHCFKRFTKAAGSSWKEGHIGNSGVGKRVVSTLIVFLMVFSLVQGITTDVLAANEGYITSLDLTVADDGLVHIWGTAKVRSPNSGVGGLYWNVIWDRATVSSQSQTYVCIPKYQTRTHTWIDQTAGTTQFDVTFYVSQAGTHNFGLDFGDSTSGQARGYSIPSTLSSKVNNIKIDKICPADKAGTAQANLRELVPYATGFDARMRMIFDQGDAYTSAKVYWKKSTDTSFTEANSKSYPYVGVDNIGLMVDGLVPGTTYDAYVKLTTRYGKTITTGTSSVEVGTPSAVTNFKTLPWNKGYKMTWGAPADLRGGTLQGYHVYKSLDRTDANLVATLPATTTEYLYTDTNKANGVVASVGGYTRLYVCAYTQYGNGALAYSDVSSIWIGSPLPPAAPTVTKSSTARTYTVSWAKPADNGTQSAYPITNYRVYRSGTLIDTVASNVTSKTYTWPADLTNYTITVRAVNANGDGVLSDGSTFKTNGVPAAPTLSSVAATGLDGQDHIC